MILVLCVGCTVNAQVNLKPRALQVTVNKTTNLLFPASIANVDRGSDRIVVQKSVSNILRVKADTAFSDTTNLSVITSDGKLYSFLVSYASSPDVLTLDLGVGELVTVDTALFNLAGSVLKMKSNLYGLHYSVGNVQLTVAGIYTAKDKLIIKLRIENSSSLSFETGQIRFHVAAKKEGKRRAFQETEVMPLLSPVSTIAREKQSVLLSIVLPKIAVDRQKIVRIDLNEKNGERHLSLRLPSKYILNALLIP